MQQIRGEIDRLVSGLRGLESATDQVNQELADSIVNYRKASQEAIALRGSWKQLERSGEATEEQFEELSQRIREVQTREREAIEETRKLAMAFTSVEGNADEFQTQLRLLNEQLDKSQGYIDGVSVEAKQSTQAISRLGSEVKELGAASKEMAVDTKRGADGIERVGDESRRAADGVDKITDHTRRASQELKRMNDSALGTKVMANIISEAMEEAIYAIGRFASEGIQEFWDFDRGMREISTLVPGHTAEMREAMGEDIQALSIDLGRMSEEMLPAVYQALSSGRGTETVLEDVALASEAARASVGELEGTMTSGLAVLNAYGEGAYSLQEIYDQFFFGIKEGVFTMDDLAGGMSALTSISAETKTPLEDIMATLIVMTKQGDSFNEAVELSGLLLTQLGTEGGAAANAFMDSTGQSYREFIAQGGTLGEALQAIQNHADATGQSIGSMIAGNSPFFRDQQAARAALELTGIHMQELVDTSNQARNAQGSMAEASAIMGEAAETNSLKVKAAWDVIKSQAGEALLSYQLLSFGAVETGISIENAITGAADVFKASSGAMNTETENIIEGNLAMAQSAEDLVDEFVKLEKVDDMYLGLGDVITGTTDAVKSGQEDVREALMLSFGTYTEYTNYLQKLPPEIFKVMAANDFQNEVIFEQVHALEQNAAALDREAERRAANAKGIDEARRKREQEAGAIVANRILMNDSMQGYEAEAQQVAMHLTNQGVAAQEAMHGLDIYRESLVYAGDEATATATDIDTSTEAIKEQAMELNGYWQQAGTLVDNWVTAQDQGKSAIIAANDAISASYEETFFDALLANQELTQSTLDLMVQRGYLTQEEADLRLEIAGNNQALTDLTESQAFNKLTTEQQSKAIDALISGMAQSADGAIALVTNGYAPLTGQLGEAKLEADLLGGELDYLATINAVPTVDMDLSGQISQAERLKQLLLDLASQGSAGGYGGYQNEDGGVPGGANIPQNASGTSNFPGGLTWVGEQGPEIVALPPASRIYSNQDSRQMMGKTVNIGGDTFIMNNRGQDEAQAAAQIVMNRRKERANAAARIH